jgi:hypothetical protein
MMPNAGIHDRGGLKLIIALSEKPSINNLTLGFSAVIVGLDGCYFLVSFILSMASAAPSLTF